MNKIDAGKQGSASVFREGPDRDCPWLCDSHAAPPFGSGSGQAQHTQEWERLGSNKALFVKALRCEFGMILMCHDIFFS